MLRRSTRKHENGQSPPGKGKSREALEWVVNWSRPTPALRDRLKSRNPSTAGIFLRVRTQAMCWQACDDLEFPLQSTEPSLRRSYYFQGIGQPLLTRHRLLVSVQGYRQVDSLVKTL